MTYQVDWTPDAENDLAALWAAAPDRRAVTTASGWLDIALAHAPFRLGQPWASSVHRIAGAGPIGIEFEVIEDDKRVIVHAVFAVG
jgi:hypothetical protein